MRREGTSRPGRAPLDRSWFTWPVALLLSAALLSLPALAEERRHSWEAGVFAGYTIYGNELEIDDGADYGLRVGWNFAPPYEIEFQYYRGSGTNITDLGSTLVANDAIFLNEQSRTWTPTAYTARFIINPRNERRRLKPYMQMGLGFLEWSPNPSLASASIGDTEAWLFSIGGGIRYKLGAYTQLRAEFEDLYAVSEVYSNFHLNVGLTWVFGGGRPADTDGDGILDLKDRCPDTPAGALVDQHNGCPWDTDGDGVMEGLDMCAATAQGWPVDDKGCPLDTDADAVPDGVDSCADTPKGAIVDPNGCPADSDKDGIFDGVDRCAATPTGAIVDGLDTATPGCPHDIDGDGIYDGVDQCALTPPGAIVDEKGCPKDSDGDRVLDGIDQCPDTPKGARLDRDGCPRVRLDKPEAQILQNVKFHGMELYPGVDAWLMLLVEAAQYWPDVIFEVGVYTDNEGGVAANRAAAARRAEVLRPWLINAGVPAKQFVTKAYGPVNFIADNSTEEGRDKNRRVEVKRLSGDIRRHPKPVEEPVEAPPGESTPPAEGATPEPAAEVPAPPAVEAPNQPNAEPPAEKPPAAEPAPAEPPPAAEPAPAEPGPAEPKPPEPKPDEPPPAAEPGPQEPKPPSGGGL